MPDQLVFATNNNHKLEEVKALLPHLTILSLKEINCFEDIPETADTLEGNAIIKANYVTEKYGYDCFADDTGLEVAALNGAPGVYSARYAGEACSSEANIEKLLKNLAGKANRDAQFKTVIALNLKGKQHLFEGRCKGRISAHLKGENGFGYDPVFYPENNILSFAEMSLEAKSSISHRGRAVQQLISFLKS